MLWAKEMLDLLLRGKAEVTLLLQGGGLQKLLLKVRGPLALLVWDGGLLKLLLWYKGLLWGGGPLTSVFWGFFFFKQKGHDLDVLSLGAADFTPQRKTDHGLAVLR